MALPAGVSFGPRAAEPSVVPLWLFMGVAVVAAWGWWRVINPRAAAVDPHFGTPSKPHWANGHPPPAATFAGNSAGQPPGGRYQ